MVVCSTADNSIDSQMALLIVNEQKVTEIPKAPDQAARLHRLSRLMKDRTLTFRNPQGHKHVRACVHVCLGIEHKAFPLSNVSNNFYFYVETGSH